MQFFGDAGLGHVEDGNQGAVVVCLVGVGALWCGARGTRVHATGSRGFRMKGVTNEWHTKHPTWDLRHC